MTCGTSSATGTRTGLALDQQRAAGIRLRTARADAIDDATLAVDLLPPSTLVQAHWIVEHLTLIGLLTLRAPTNGTPVCGLFLCPPGTPPVETLAQGQAAPGIVIAARPIVLPVSERAVPSEALSNGSFAINVTMQPGFKATVPGGGWFLRGIVNCGPGTPTPGPGAGSFLILNASIVDESDVR